MAALTQKDHTGDGLTMEEACSCPSTVQGARLIDHLVPFERRGSQASLACPYPNGSTPVINPPGMEFEILCNTNIATEDLCWFGEPSGCPTPAETMATCLETCTHNQNPLCQSVVFDPEHKKCYTKAADKQNVTEFVQARSSPPLHAAVALLPDLDWSCTQGQVLNTSVGEHFKMDCNTDRPFDDLEAGFHSDTLDTCLNACAEYIGEQGERCHAVVWDPTMRKGFSNCYPKAEVPSPLDIPHFMSAVRTDQPVTLTNKPNGDGGGDQGNTGPSDRQGGGGPDSKTNAGASATTTSDKTWIAGPVIGGIAFVAIVVGLFWFYRRRRRSQNSQAPPPPNREVLSWQLNAPAEVDCNVISELDTTPRDPRQLELYAGRKSSELGFQELD